MPFLVYRLDRKLGETTRVRLKQQVSLGGGNGPLAALVHERSRGEGVFPWQMVEAELLKRLQQAPADEHALLVDLKPSVKDNISLYRVRRLWGYSYPAWTPLAVQIEALYVDKTHPDPDKFKRDCPLPSAPGQLVHEFLYLLGGTEEGRWAWGRVGSVNGCLLWPDAFNHFVECIRPYTET